MHEILLKTTRSTIADTVFYGSVFHANRDGIFYSIGVNESEICFMRSLAKPIQASILFDSNIIKDCNITHKEIAIFCGSHSGSKTHITLLKNILKRNNLCSRDLLLTPLKPLDLRNFKGHITKLHNNCSGKHVMMLLNCKYNGFDYNYTNPNHNLQKMIKSNQDKLSCYNSNILSYDGCSTPLWGLPYKNVIKAYFNLIESYPQLINAIISNPYIFGGYDRLDTEIIKLSKKKLFAKVGAGGLVLIYNFEKKEIILIKMAQDNNVYRRLIVFDYLNKIGWLNYSIDKNVYNQKKQIVAKYEFSL